MTEPENRRLPRPAFVPARADETWTALLEAVPGAGDRIEALDSYTPAIRQLNAMSLLVAEVNNGGFSQFFFNGRGAYLDDAIAGFEAAGLDGYRELSIEVADHAMARLGALQAAQRGGSVDAYAEWAATSGLEAYDDRWWELPDLDSALDRFVAEHAAEIWA